MLRALGDPYTRYLPPTAYTQLQGGRGRHATPASGWRSLRAHRGLLVTASIPGFPAARRASAPAT